MGLTDLEKKVLLELAGKGPLSGYDFHLGGKHVRAGREAIMSSSYWLKVKQSLLEKKLIQPKKVKGRRKARSDERGRRKDLYWLTEAGAVAALSFGATPGLLMSFMKHFESEEDMENVKMWAELAKVWGPQRFQAFYMIAKSNESDPLKIGKATKFADDIEATRESAKIISRNPKASLFLKEVFKVLGEYFEKL